MTADAACILLRMSPAGHHQAFIRLRSAGHWLVDPQLRPKLVADAHESDVSLTEVVNRILAARYSVAVDAGHRKTTRPELEGEELNVRIPEALYRKISVHAAQQGKATPDVIREQLSAHYGLPMPVRLRARRPRGNGAPAAA